MADQQRYKSYLLRLWRVHRPGGATWRASLEEPGTGARLGFSSITRLHEFLLDQTDAAPSQAETASTGATAAAPSDDDSP